MNIKLTFISVLAATLLSSCGERLSGTWAVQKYEILIPGRQSILLNNIGTFTFRNDHTGTRLIKYSLMGIQYSDTSSFTWTFDRTYVTIKPAHSDSAKIWLIKKDEISFQRWQSTEGHGLVQIMDLKRLSYRD